MIKYNRDEWCKYLNHKCDSELLYGNDNASTSTSTWLLPRAITSQASDINNMDKSTKVHIYS